MAALSQGPEHHAGHFFARRRQARPRSAHCSKSDHECEFNPHTELCRKWKLELDKLKDKEKKLEPLYRQWRSLYLAGPRKPVFKYPSAKLLPMPKIFGEGFFEADFRRNVLKLRLDDMQPGEWLEFGFTPWPRGYVPRADQAEITSVNVVFVGTRPRVGFHFKVAHKPSRIGVSQDEIDQMREGAAQDNAFLEAARRRVLESFPPGEKALRVLAIDLGTTGCGWAFMEGRALDANNGGTLPVLKLDRLLAEKPDKSEEDEKRGLTASHVGGHLASASLEVREIAKHTTRQSPKAAMRKPMTFRLGEKPPESPKNPGTLRSHDLRGRFVHTARMLKDWVRLNARQIIAKAEEVNADLIVFESMRGFTAPATDDVRQDLEKKARVAFFSYGRIRRKVSEKAVERGMRVLTLPYKKSSQVCAQCGKPQANEKRVKENKKRRKFLCEHESCKFDCHSDVNAALVLGRVFWGDVKLPD